jgi:DnaJ like chaperone protein
MSRKRGKLFGAALGFSFGGPIGALLGTAIGHLVDISDDGSPAGSGAAQGFMQRRSDENLNFITSLIYLLIGTSGSDGAVTREEIAVISNFFRGQLGYGEPQLFVINRIIKAAVEQPINIEEACTDIRGKTEYEERLFLVRLCYEVAISDRSINRQEEEYIHRASRELGIEEYDFAMVRRTFIETGHEQSRPARGKRDPYTVLGLHPDCTDEAVQQSYRNLAAKYHPDKVSHLGREFIDLATDKFTEIQNAYEEIMNNRRNPD